MGKLLFTLNTEAWFVHDREAAQTNAALAHQNKWGRLPSMSAVFEYHFIRLFSFSVKIISSLDSEEAAAARRSKLFQALQALPNSEEEQSPNLLWG